MNKLSETVEMMNSSDYKEEFRVEYKMLKMRMEGLSDMLDEYKEGILNLKPSYMYDLLNEQLKALDMYASCLEEIAEKEGIKLL